MVVELLALEATAQAARTILTSAVFGAIIAFVYKGTSTESYVQDIDKIWFALLSNELSQTLHGVSAISTKSAEKLVSRKKYNWSLSTQENYRGYEDCDYGRYAEIRKNLDKKYHRLYSKARQLFQDTIIDSMLSDMEESVCQNGQRCNHTESPWIVFTAGAMGAGKSHTIRLLESKGRFPLHSFVTVDPDQIRYQLPEFSGYVARCSETAGELTGNECGMIAEILTRAALLRGHNVLVDGSLRNATWYKSHFEVLRQMQPRLRIAILHIQAPRDAIFERARNRAKTTGRVVPRELLEQTIDQVPKSVAILKTCVDYTAEIRNDPDADDVNLVSGNWEQFRQVWDS